jgi:hypothetical protein
VNEATPEAPRTAVAETESAQEVASLLFWTPDAPVAEAILDWLAATKPTYAPVFANNLCPSFPTATRDKAKAVREAARAKG